MIEITVNGEKKMLPSSWRDITWAKYCEVLSAMKLPVHERMAVYTGLPVETLTALTVRAFAALCEAVDFMENHGILPELATPFSSDLNIGADTYGKIEACRQKATNDISPMLAGALICDKYLGEEIKDANVLDVYNKVHVFIEKMNTFLEKYKRMNDYQPSEDEIEAGIDQLNRFGVWGTAVAYARRTNMTPEQVLERPASEIYTTLLYDFEQSEFQKRLRLSKERSNKFKGG